MKINTLLQTTGMWRASSMECNPHTGTPTGFALLDRYLPGGGWPANGIAELLHDHRGIGEFRLLAPALAHLSRTQDRWLLWAAPPFVPYAPALLAAGIDLSRVLVANPRKPGDLLWVLEKALASGSCSAVLAWPRTIHGKEVRRLQVAGRQGRCLGILFRSGRAARQSSPAELRIRLYGMVPSPLDEHSALQLRILKRRGGWPTELLTVDFDDKLNQMTPDFREIPVAPVPAAARPGVVIDYRSPPVLSLDPHRPD